MLDTELQGGSQESEESSAAGDTGSGDSQELDTQDQDSNDTGTAGEQETGTRDYEAELNRFKNQNNGLTRKVGELMSALQDMQGKLNSLQQPQAQTQQEQYKPFYERNLEGLSQKEIGQLMIEEQKRIAQDTVRQLMEEQEMTRAEAERQAAQQAAAQKINSVIEELRTSGMSDEQELKLRDYLRDNYHNLIKFAYNEVFGTKQKAEEARNNGEKLLKRIADASKNKLGSRSPNINPKSMEKMTQKEREEMFDKLGPAAFIQS